MTARTAAVLLSLALVTSACTNTTPEPSDTSDATATETTDVESSEGSATQPSQGTPPGDPADVPALPIVAAEGFAEPGATIEVAGDSRLEGELFLVGPDGDVSSATMETGSATLPIPSGTSPGRYGLRLGEDEAWGSVTVLNSPGLAVLGREYVLAGAAPEVEVLVHGINRGDVVALELVSGDGTTDRLVPHPLLGLAPMPATSTVQGLAEGRHRLTLPAGFEGRVRLVAGAADLVADPFEDGLLSVTSPELLIRTCDEASFVSGDLGGGGVVSVITAGSQSPARTVTDDGAFRMDVIPGWSLVKAIRVGGSIPAGSPQLVRVGCGAVVDLGDLEAAVDTGPPPGAYLGGLTSDDLWAYTATATGDVAFEQDSFAECSVSDGILEVEFGNSTADPWLYSLTLGPPVDTGTYEGSLHLEDIFTGETAEGTLAGEIELGRVEDFDAVGGAFTGSIEGALGQIDLDLRFSCAVFSLTGGLTTPSPTGVLAALPAATSPGALLLAQAGGSGVGSSDPCKKLFIEGRQPEGVAGVEVVMEWWAADLAGAVPRVSTLTGDDLRNLLNYEAGRQLLGGSDSDGGGTDLGSAVESDFLIYLTNTKAGETWFFTADLYDLEKARKLARVEVTGSTAEAAAQAAKAQWTQMVEPLSNAGLCAEFAPTTTTVDVGASDDFTIEVTNLAGNPAESAEVKAITSECGTWQPPSGSIDGTSWETKFTATDKACAETVSARVTAQGTVDEVDAYPEASVQVEGLWQFATTITFDDEHSHIVAESSGEFFVESDFDALIGAGDGYIEGSGEAYCEVNGAVTWQPYELVGTYKVMVTGAVTERPEIDAPWTVEFAPVGFEINTEMTYRTSSDCIEAGTYRNDLLGFLGAGALVGMPHWYANQPNGFITSMRPEGDGVPFEEALIGLPGGSIRGNLWKPQP